MQGRYRVSFGWMRITFRVGIRIALGEIRLGLGLAIALDHFRDHFRGDAREI